MRTIFLSLAATLMIASGFVFSVDAVQDTAITTSSETQVAASRYHQRGRTNNFFKRTSRGRKC